MSISDAFTHGKAFIAFITCGDPDLETTEKLIYSLEKAGVDLIELGIPFSDPTAEGPVIQDANIRALLGGTTTDKIFGIVKRVRANTSIPLAFITYANVVFSYGTERFLQAASKAGVDGIFLSDVPFEEKEEFEDVCEAAELDLVSLIAPTSNGRVAMIAKEAKGFLSCVSSIGVTGTQGSLTTDIADIMSTVHSVSDIPVAVGCGISTPEQAAEMAAKADGVIVGSAIVELIAEHGRKSAAPVYDYAKSIADAVKSVKA